MKHEAFEDQMIVSAYMRAIPRANENYRSVLRARLAAAPAGNRIPLPRLRWPVAAISVAAASAVVVAAILATSLSPRTAAPVSAKTILARVAKADANAVPFSGTSEFQVLGVGDEPNSARVDVDRQRIVTTFAVRDQTHFRFDTSTLGPVLNSQTQTIVKNGSSTIDYSTIDNRAIRYPAGPAGGPFSLGFGATIFGESIQRILASFNGGQGGMHAALIGHATVLGRKVDIVKIWPAVSVTSNCNGAAQCRQRSTEHGHILLWVDVQHSVVLRYQEFGMDANGNFPAGTLYRVTSITFGQGPTDQALAYRPPGPVQPNRGGWESSRSVISGTFAPWRAPGGFIPVGTPTFHRSQYVLEGQGEAADEAGRQKLSYASALYGLNAPPRGSTRALTGPYIYIEERYRVAGLPGALLLGTPIQAGSCQVSTGKYPDGLMWLSLARGKISLLLTAHQLSQPQLIHYAATKICGSA